LGALRQLTSEYASILLEVNERNGEKVPDLNFCNPRHGFPFHIAVLSQKFDIALRMLDLDCIDATVKSNIGANIGHLLFVKYDKDPILAKKILFKCEEHKVDLNHIDTLKAAPIHVAIRKRQYQAIIDCVELNHNFNR
jgi:hypothetical protein